MGMRTLDVPTTSISDVKRSPMEAFQRADREAAGLYVFNREKVAGAMLTQQQYESLNKEIEELYSRLDDLTVEMRISNKNVRTYSDSEVRGAQVNHPSTIDEMDGWE